MTSIYDFDYTSLEGKTVSMRDYEGKVLIIVNTATKCGFAGQFEGLEKLYRDYKDKGLVVLGFPSNQFHGQEPQTDAEMAGTCKLRWGVTFPLAAKSDVRGPSATPIFKYLIQQKPFEGWHTANLKAKGLEATLRLENSKYFKDDEIKWNFTKFLIGRDGSVLQRFETPETPESMVPAIEKALSE